MQPDRSVCSYCIVAEKGGGFWLPFSVSLFVNELKLITLLFAGQLEHACLLGGMILCPGIGKLLFSVKCSTRVLPL